MSRVLSKNPLSFWDALPGLVFFEAVCRIYPGSTDCRYYAVEGSDVAYVSEGRLREILRRTYDKLSRTVQAYRRGNRTTSLMDFRDALRIVYHKARLSTTTALDRRTAAPAECFGIC